MRRPGEALSRLAAARGRLGHRLREPLEHRRRLRPLPAREDRPAVRPALARDGARGRLPAAGGRRMSRLPIRLRLTLPFALVMAVVLAAMGFFVYVRVGGALLALDRPEPARPGGRVGAHSSRGAPRSRRDAAEARRRAGHRAGRPASRQSDPPPAAAAARRGRRCGARCGGERILRLGATCRACASDWRVLAGPARVAARRRARRRAVARGRARDARPPARELLLAGPLALLLAILAGYGARRRRAAAGRGDAAGARRRSRPRRPGARLPVPPARDEISRLAETLNEMLGAARGGVRARAALRRRREPRAAHAARAAADRARARAAPAALARRARGGAALGGGGDRAADAPRRGPAADRALGRRAGCRSGASGSRRAEVLDDVAARFARARGERGRRARRRARPDGLVLDADPVRLEQALGNLVDNALAHGGGRVELSSPSGAASSSSSTSRTRAPAFRRLRRRARSTASAAPTRRAAARRQRARALDRRADRPRARRQRGESRTGADGGADVWITLAGLKASRQPRSHRHLSSRLIAVSSRLGNWRACRPPRQRLRCSPGRRRSASAG